MILLRDTGLLLSTNSAEVRIFGRDADDRWKLFEYEDENKPLLPMAAGIVHVLHCLYLHLVWERPSFEPSFVP